MHKKKKKKKKTGLEIGDNLHKKKNKKKLMSRCRLLKILPRMLSVKFFEKEKKKKKKKGNDSIKLENIDVNKVDTY